MTLDQIVKRTSLLISQNAPAILTGMGVAGVLSTAYLAEKAGRKGALRVQKAWEEGEYDDIQDTRLAYVTKTLQLQWKYFIPVALSSAATIGFIISAQTVNHRRQAALMSALTLSETAYREYREKVITQMGKTADRKVTEEVAQDQVDSHKGDVIVLGKGNHLCYESVTGRMFRSDIETIRKAENEINRHINNEMYASLNDFNRLIGLPVTDIGDTIGWNTDKHLDLQFTSRLVDDEPVIHIGYWNMPSVTYQQLW